MKKAVFFLFIILFSSMVFAQEPLFKVKLGLEEKIIYRPNPLTGWAASTIGLDKEIIYSPELTAWVSFESLGTEPPPVDLTYIIADEEGNEVYRESGHVAVYTEEFITKKFDKLDLKAGKYNLILKILYNVNVTDEVKEDFEVKEEKINWIYYMIGFVALVVLLFVLMKRRKEIK